MRRIRLLLEYDGSAYHGWQVQRDEVSIQGIVEDSVRRITGEEASVAGASRTDAGVHALGQVASFRTKSRLDAATMKRALNSVLPHDIRVLDASTAADSFHPRADAIRKTYFYIVTNQKNSSAFLGRYSWLVPQSLDTHSLTEASRVLIGRHDFSSFMGAGSDVKDFVREIYSLDVERLDSVNFMTSPIRGNFLRISIQANGFLRHMVRNIVGTLIEIGRARIRADKMKDILESCDRNLAGQTAPARGLFLERIVY